ncbi:hypothetical protein [Paraferrimonas sedimenticola]|uniref:Uncharacterized protein n=1 Tax=Paraferrimonas sedimenticola TaxID=375674 RepID=A0AA37RZJ7_9GAMM|nr:hypothetical protein [Paraferrimonas sedimenticola]GLP98093.1 hypothetical protein GCM10007895_34000 [Paraferrimonas sedimenticola]
MSKEKKKNNTWWAALLIIFSRIFFLGGLIPIFQFVQGAEENLLRAGLLILSGVVTAIVGFSLVGASKTAWLQLPHQTLAILGVTLFIYGGIEIYDGNGSATLWILVLLGPIFVLSWMYCSKHNIYKA